MSEEAATNEVEVNEIDETVEPVAEVEAVTEQAASEVETEAAEVEQQEPEVEEPVAETEQPEVEAEQSGENAEAPAAEAEVEEPVAEAEMPVAEETEPSADVETAEAEPAATEETTAANDLNINDLKLGMELTGTVKSIELYGAFVDVGVGKDALLHISQLGKPNVRNVEDVVKKGEQITVYILKVEASSGRIALSLEKPPENPMSQLKVGDLVTGEVTRIENFGVFLEIGAERPGMIHVSELASGYVKSPEDVVKMGDEVQARVIKLNRKKRQIDLSIKAIEEERVQAEAAAVAAEIEDDEPVPTAMELALRRALNESQDETISRGGEDKKQRNSKKKRKALEDVLSRTLKNHNE